MKQIKKTYVPQGNPNECPKGAGHDDTGNRGTCGKCGQDMEKGE